MIQTTLVDVENGIEHNFKYSSPCLTSSKFGMVLNPNVGFLRFFFCHSFWTEQGYHYLLHLSRFSSTRVYWNHEYSMSQNFWKNTIFLTNKWFLNREPIWFFVGISPSTVIGKDSTKKAEKSTIVHSVVILSQKLDFGQKRFTDFDISKTPEHGFFWM